MTQSTKATSRQDLIAIVSGLGPLAGADVLTKMLAHAADVHGAREDVDYPPVLLLSHGIVGFDDTGSIHDNFEHELVKFVRELELHRPAVIGVACNTAHLYYDSMRAASGAQFVNIIDATARRASQDRGRHYLLLSSSTTRRTGLYHRALDREKVSYCEVTGDEQRDVDQVVDAVMGHQLAEASERLVAVLGECAQHHSFDAIIAGCTELPLALDASSGRVAVPVVESNRCLAEGLLHAYLDREPTAVRSWGSQPRLKGLSSLR